MPRFAYTAIDAAGSSVEGVTKASTLGEARTNILADNLYPVKIEEKRGALQIELTTVKVKKKELMHFTRQLAVFVKAGIPLTEAMEKPLMIGRSDRRPKASRIPMGRAKIAPVRPTSTFSMIPPQ